MHHPTDLLRWLQRKRYQYEVTFSLYMLTPTEKFIFNSFLFLFISMIIIAASLYLPEHVTTILSRAWFYYAGDEQGAQAAGAVAAHTVVVAGAGAGAGAGVPAGGGAKGGGQRMEGQRVLDMLGTL